MADTDGLLEQISGLLNSPEGMAQLQNAAQMLGLGGQGQPAGALQGQAGFPSPIQTGPPAGLPGAVGPAGGTAGPVGQGGSDLASMLAALGPQNGQPPFQQTGGIGMDPQMMFRLVQMMQAANRETPASRLLRALQPLLREERRGRVDDAIRMIQLFSLLPLLRGGG